MRIVGAVGNDGPVDTAGETVAVVGIGVARLWQGTPCLLDLTPTEFKLLRYLLINAGRVMSKAQILDHVWQYDFGGGDNVVETYISYLRKKVDRERPPLIHTVRGVGYSLRLPKE